MLRRLLGGNTLNSSILILCYFILGRVEEKKTITAAAACNDARLGEKWAGETSGAGGHLSPPLKKIIFNKLEALHHSEIDGAQYV